MAPLAEKNSFISSFKWPRALLLCVGVIFIFEACVGVFLHQNWKNLFLYSNPYQDDPLRFRAQLEIFKAAENTPAFFFMGSSQTREAIDPTALEEKLLSEKSLNTKVLNLGVSGGWTATLYMQLDEVLQRKPEVIVAMPYWQGFYLDFDAAKTKNYIFSLETLTFMAKVYGSREFFRLFKEYFLGCFLAHAMPSYRYRASLVSILKRWVIDRQKRERPVWFAHQKEEMLEDLEKRLAEKKDSSLSPNRQSEVDKTIFLRFVERIQNEGITLIVLESPWHPLTEKLWGQYAPAKTDYDAFMEAMATKYGFDYIRFTELPKFEEGDFISLPYLNERGRRKFTEFLSKRLSPTLQKSLLRQSQEASKPS